MHYSFSIFGLNITYEFRYDVKYIYIGNWVWLYDTGRKYLNIYDRRVRQEEWSKYL